MQLADIKPGLTLVGLEPDRVCTVVAVMPIAETAVQVYFKLPDGTLKDRLLYPADEAGIAVATVERPWAFDGDAAAFQLACEAKRIDLAFLFDPMMAVHTSNVDPLPHQITAVYETLLPRQPLRFVLADDPGAGKTIMAGLYIRELIMRADARRVQPFFVRSFFLKAFATLGGTIHRREAERWEITHVPAAIREQDRRLSGRNRREQEPVLRRYDRVCFTRDAIQPLDRPGLARAALMHPGHPLMLAMTDIVLEQNANLLRRGTVLVDPADEADQPWLLFLLTHEVKSGDGATLSRRMQFIRVNPDGSSSFAGWAPHLDLEPLAAADRPRIADLIGAPWVRTDQEQRAVALAVLTLVPEHFKEVAGRRVEHVDRTLAAVHERLTKEIAYWTNREIRLKDDIKAGRDVRLNLDNVKRTLEDLQTRLESRRKELQAMRQVQNGTPIILGGALVVPVGLLRKLRGEGPALSAADAAARKKVEALAMRAVIRAEEAKGHRVVDVSADKCGWDLTSYPPPVNGLQPDPVHIEVKGRVKGADTITVSRNEILYAVNQGDKFVLTVVFVNPDDSTEDPLYIKNPFQKVPDWGAASVNYAIDKLLQSANRTQ